MSTTSRKPRFRDDLPYGVFEFILGPCLTRSPLGDHCPNRLEEGYIITDTQSLLMRNRQGKRLGQLSNGTKEAVLAIFLSQNVFLCGRQQAKPLLGCSRNHSEQSKPWNKPQQISYFSSRILTASSWLMAVRPVPPLSV